MKKYALVGAGNRALHMFAKPLTDELKDQAELVGVYDTNTHRAQQLSLQCRGVPVYNSFEEMLQRSGADEIIVASVDYTHDEYIIRALEAGLDVISEKPMTINHAKCNAILEAENRTGNKVTVTFNARFNPYTARIKELIKEGYVGDILSVHMEWMLDTSHGADYFRRWHRYLEKSGGLLVHKSTHHFDLINWWLEEEPLELRAFGSRRFYGPTREKRGERCLTCNYQKECEFYFDIREKDFHQNFYLEAEGFDGYYRDQCVFADDIDIYDTMSVNVLYSRGTQLSYSLTAHSPYEGWKVSINGTKGRLEASNTYNGANAKALHNEIKLFNRSGEEITIKLNKLEGSHGGSDYLLRRMLFVGDVPDRLGQMADSRAGALSLLIGDAANISIADNRSVKIGELLSFAHA
ncbi:Gfo/Idh/MocA family protein [Paenibacillus koleovorans]|uniref:Gfo/Idh/MocA family protein n=1 Tax=Paenibacillus koleovorans TaxID=121608 RepID=UPI000FDC249F|nr:Gfo/Idh/MocA family oxidoreductase [Paenibacillus koleovorans]